MHLIWPILRNFYSVLDGSISELTLVSEIREIYCFFLLMMKVAILKEELAAEQVLNVYQCGGSLINPSIVLTGL